MLSLSQNRTPEKFEKNVTINKSTDTFFQEFKDYRSCHLSSAFRWSTGSREISDRLRCRWWQCVNSRSYIRRSLRIVKLWELIKRFTKSFMNRNNSLTYSQNKNNYYDWKKGHVYNHWYTNKFTCNLYYLLWQLW